MGAMPRGKRELLSIPPFEPSDPSETLSRSGETVFSNRPVRTVLGRIETLRMFALGAAFGRFGRFVEGDR